MTAMRCGVVLLLAISACGRLGFDGIGAPGDGAPADTRADAARDATDCGGTWCAEESTVTDDLDAVWGASSADVWAVGGGTTIVRRTNGTWTRYAPHPVANNLREVRGLSASDVWTFGDGGSVGHWDGTAWTAMTTGGSYLESSIGFAANDVWVIGWNPAYAAHWNGSGWSANVLPASITEPHAVWGAAPNDIWAGGAGGELMHWNGTAWAAAASNTTQKIQAMHGLAANNIWAALTGGTTLHYDGVAWSEVDTPSFSDLTGIWAVSPSEVWACGSDGAVIRWDGSAWSEVMSGTPRYLSGMGGTPEDVFVVGGIGTILRRP